MRGEPYKDYHAGGYLGQTPEELEQVESAINDIILPEDQLPRYLSITGGRMGYR